MFWQIFAAGIGFGSMGAAMAYYRHWRANRLNVYYVRTRSGDLIDAIIPWERRAKFAFWLFAAFIVVMGVLAVGGDYPFGPTGFL